MPAILTSSCDHLDHRRGRLRDPEEHEAAGGQVDVVDDVVERRREQLEVLAVDRGDEDLGELLVDLVDDRVGLVLEVSHGLVDRRRRRPRW
jgi:hypothetical protein